MTGKIETQLEVLRKKLKIGKSDLARVLDMPHSTVRDWLSGENPTPGIAIVAVNLLIERDRWVLDRILDKVGRDDLSEGLEAKGGHR